METKEYFEKVMQDYNQHRKGRNLRKYCSDEGLIISGWLSIRRIMVLVSLRLRMLGKINQPLYLFRLLKNALIILKVNLQRLAGVSNSLYYLRLVVMI